MATTASTSHYVAAIEDCFVALRGRGVQWAPQDAALAAKWAQRAVPIDLIVRVLGARVRAWQYRHGDAARVPLHLGWYAPAVTQAVRGVLFAPIAVCNGTAAAGSGDAGLRDQDDTLVADPDDAANHATLAELLDPLPTLEEEAGHLALREAYRRAFLLLDAAQRPKADDDVPGDPDDDFADLPAVDRVVQQCRTMMRRVVLDGLNATESEVLHQEVAARVAPLARRAAKRIVAEQTVAAQLDWMAGALGLHLPTLAGWTLASAA